MSPGFARLSRDPEISLPYAETGAPGIWKTGCPEIIMIKSLFAVCVGASAGAALRWLISLALNPLFSGLPLGTLAANLIGAFCIGLALGLFARYPDIAPHWRLLIVTGFLGGLTTFSSFSAEVAGLFLRGRVVSAMAGIALHVGGSLAMTFLGMGAATLARSFLR